MPIQEELEVLSLQSFSAPFSFGKHPDFEKDFRKNRKRARCLIKKGRLEKFEEAVMGKKTYLSELFNPKHPDVFLIPRCKHLFVVDDWEDAIGFERISFPFSSTDFYVDIDKEESVFYPFGHSGAFFRIGGIDQLGYLVPPRPDDWDKNVSVAYIMPQFPHTRWIHSMITAILMEVILSRNGFSKKDRDPKVLTAASHDIAIPAGGDSVKRVDPDNLREEDNFIWVLQYYGLEKAWSENFSFNSELAKEWVEGNGVFGELLDAIDKISYTALDCYYLGLTREGKVRDSCSKNP